MEFKLSHENPTGYRLVKNLFANLKENDQYTHLYRDPNYVAGIFIGSATTLILGISSLGLKSLRCKMLLMIPGIQFLIMNMDQLLNKPFINRATLSGDNTP